MVLQACYAAPAVTPLLAKAATYMDVPRPHMVSFIVVGMAFFTTLTARALLKLKYSFSGPLRMLRRPNTNTRIMPHYTALAIPVAAAAP